MSDAALSISDLRVTIGAREIVKGVSLDAPAGAITALLGESGSGKTMTLLSVIGLLPQGSRASGSILVSGEQVLGATEAKLNAWRGARMGLVFQEPMTALNPVRTIGAQVAETIQLHERGVSALHAVTRAREALDRAGLSGIEANRYPHALSGGQRQRVAIAIATALKPAVLLADEPTSALDVLTQAEILALFAKRAHDEGAAVLLVTHDVGLAARAADRVAIMKSGVIVDQGTTAEVLLKPRHAETQALVSASTRSVRRAVSPAEAPVVLEARNVVAAYETNRSLIGGGVTTRAVDGVSFALKRGECLGVVGESGSGKSTIARAILGLELLRSGEIHLGGERFATADKQALRRLRRRVQIVFQDPSSSFDPRWRVGRIVAEPAHLLEQQPAPGELQTRVRAMLTRVGLKAEDADKFPHEFSGGQRQRIGLARALFTEPDLVVLDEAVSALDAATRADMLDLLAELQERLSLSYLFITHDLALVRRVADRVIVLRAGKIVEEGATDAVLSAPRDPYTQALAAASVALSET